MLDEAGVEVDVHDLVLLHIELTPSEFDLVDTLDCWDVDFAEGFTSGPYVLYQEAQKIGAFVCECGVEEESASAPVALHPLAAWQHRIDFDTKIENPTAAGEEWAGLPYHA